MISVNAIAGKYHNLLAISGMSMRNILAAENKERSLRLVFRIFTISDQYSFQKLLICQTDISAFSGQNKVTKMRPKYILTCLIVYEILINRSGEIKQEQNRLFI